MRVLTTAQMREADRITIEDVGIPSLVLMENAGRQVAAAIEALFPDLASSRVAILAGRGNNGGDGFVIARTLLERVADVPVFVIGPLSEVRGDARHNLEVLGHLGVSVVEIADEQAWELHFSEIQTCDLVVDAIVGTGLGRPLDGMYPTIVGDLNGSSLPVVSVDVPSGLHADSHEIQGDAVLATATVALAAPKICHVLPPAQRMCGQLVVADIGIPDMILDRLDGPQVEVITAGMVRSVIEPRDVDAHKGQFGRVLIVAGSMGKTGAAHLAAMAALRSGAGLVTVATPRSVQPILAAMAPEYMTIGLPEDEAGQVTADAVARVLSLQADVIAMGPGLGSGAGVRAFVHGVIGGARAPLVLDADALNACAGEHVSLLRGREGRDVIVTPHPAEMARLLGSTVDLVQGDRVAAARALAEAQQIHVVLKGHRTIVAAPEGRVAINMTGNPGMATGGTGDVLTGVVAAWLAQLRDAEGAARLGVYVHGQAGDIARADLGETALVATDLLDHLGDAVVALTSDADDAGDEDA
ncbi:MAG: NAD(P)H-hydrate dehydratase [Acidobacteria bacterium]|nr:NAD(P)H-hydrate dehydratase [Acidobacteriota bacterium]